MLGEEKKVTKPDDESVEIFVGEDDKVVKFRVKNKTKFEKVMVAYCKQRNVEVSSIKFVFDGMHLKASQTIGEIGLENNDTIQTFVSQIGGGGQ
eukprot:Pgem_evm1s10027